MMVLKTAIVTPHTMMVFILLPSQTIRIGASAVFGRLFSAAAPPKQHGDQCADDQYKDKTDKGFTDGNADMIKKAFISCHLQHNLKNTGRTAENESVDQMISGCYFPTGQDEDQDEKAHACNEIFLFFSFSKKFFPGCVGNRVQNSRIRHLIHPISH